MVGVVVSVGGGVSVASGVTVAVSVGAGPVADGSTVGDGVGVSVPGALDGRLQACIRKARMIISVKNLYFILSPFLLTILYLTFPSI
jgi:hypothetical protein